MSTDALTTMEKDSEKKRKLEQERQDNTIPAKRLKQEQKQPANARSMNTTPSGYQTSHEAVSSQRAQDATTDGSITTAGKKLSRKERRKRKELAKQQFSDTPAGTLSAEAARSIQDSTPSKTAVTSKRSESAASSVPAANNAPARPQWTFSPSSAGRFLDYDPVFVKDEAGLDYLIAATSQQVQFLSLEDSLVVRAYAVPESRRVTAFAVAGQIVEIALDDGSTVHWNYLTAALESGSQEPRNKPITALAKSGEASVYIRAAQGTTTIIADDKILFETSRGLTSIQILGSAEYVVAWGPDVLVLGSANSKTTNATAFHDFTWLELPMPLTIVCATARLVKAQEGNKKQQRQILAVAVGARDGSVQLYHDLSSMFNSANKNKIPTPQVLHWHRPNQLSAVKFSRDGNYMITGGRETVLVIWQLATGKKQYLPHLTCEIERIVVSPNGTRYALQMGDNSILVLNTSELQAVAHFPGLQLPIYAGLRNAPDSWNRQDCAAILCPRHTKKLLITVPSTQPRREKDVSTRPFLQTFDIRTSRHLGRQALTRNNVTDFNEGPEGDAIIPPDVPHLALSHESEWLASIDQWTPPVSDLRHLVSDLNMNAMDIDDAANLKEQQERRREVHLKIWQEDLKDKTWILNTRIDAPHTRATGADIGSGAGRVLELLADPVSDGFYTLGEDSQVKIWRPKVHLREGLPVKDENGRNRVDWTCAKTIQLPILTDAEDRADSPMASALTTSQKATIQSACMAISPDGSLLACGQTFSGEEADARVHFISPETGTIVDSKSRLAAPDADLVDVVFVDRSFVAVSKRSIRVWDLVNDHYQWNITLKDSARQLGMPMVAANHADDTFVVVTHERQNKQGGESATAYFARVYTPKSAVALFTARMYTAPTAILPVRYRGGYTFLFEDGTLRTLSCSNTGLRQAREQRMTLWQSETADAEMTDDTANVDVDLQEQESLPSALALLTGSAQDRDVDMIDAPDAVVASAEVDEDDRPVVRPEQLAKLFDSPQSYAMLPVRDMFRAVVDLYARKPKVDTDAMVA